jgi:hypothetical protein
MEEIRSKLLSYHIFSIVFNPNRWKHVASTLAVDSHNTKRLMLTDKILPFWKKN